MAAAVRLAYHSCGIAAGMPLEKLVKKKKPGKFACQCPLKNTITYTCSATSDDVGRLVSATCLSLWGEPWTVPHLKSLNCTLTLAPAIVILLSRGTC